MLKGVSIININLAYGLKMGDFPVWINFVFSNQVPTERDRSAGKNALPNYLFFDIRFTSSLASVLPHPF